ncbi:MAG: tail fiber domain-containing protein, partial [Bacteroidetes bacterium]|nr:tail fiber domain-containing protein [Bacteroidota bacterium]
SSTNSFWVWASGQWHELNADGTGETLVDTDGDTKVQVEASPDEDIIRITAKNTEMLQLNENGLFSAGTFNLSGVPPVNGAGVRTMWVPKLVALRVGEVTGTQWDQDSIGHHSSVLGGKGNKIPFSGTFTTIGGGQFNSAAGINTFLGGGYFNTGSGNDAFLGGGANNIASGFASSLGGGFYNTASGDYSFVGGGNSNTAAGSYTVVAGGIGITAPSFAEAVFGTYPGSYSPASATAFVSTDRLFVVGNGTNAGNRSNALTILKNGDIGIGTTNPEGKLHVAGDYFGKGHIWLYAQSGLNTSGIAYIQARDNSGTTDIGMRFRTQNAGSIVDAMNLSKEGYVGIGENSPINQLVIRKDANNLSSNELILKNRHATASGTGSRIVFQGYRDVNSQHEVASIEVEHQPGDLTNTVHGGALVFRTNTGDSPYSQQGYERMRISEDGIVSMSKRLDLNDGMKVVTGNINLNGKFLSGDGGSKGINVSPSGNIGAGYAAGNVHFFINGSNSMPNAFVVDATASLAGNLLVSSTGSISLDGNSDGWPDLEVTHNGTIKMDGNADGSPDLAVYNDGSVYAPLGGNGAAFPLNVVQDYNSKLRYAVSSRRYKTSIRPAEIDQDVEKFLSLELKAFQFKGDSTGLYDYGFIAEEVDALGLSRPLSWKKNGQVESLYFDHIAFFNFAALQQHRDRITELERQLKEKDEKIASFESRLKALEAQMTGTGFQENRQSIIYHVSLSVSAGFSITEWSPAFSFFLPSNKSKTPTPKFQ